MQRVTYLVGVVLVAVSSSRITTVRNVAFVVDVRYGLAYLDVWQPTNSVGV